MHPDFPQLLHSATQLTRRGELMAATRAIQLALRQAPAPGDEPPSAAPEVIDVDAREVPDPGAPALPGSGGADRGPLHAPDPADDHAAPAAFLTGRHGGAGLAGRDYKLFLPPGAGREPMPLVVMLHGCTQDPDDFAAGTRMNALAARAGVSVLYPAQSARANPQRCWNWFKTTHQSRGRGEPALLAGMVRAVMADHAIDPDRVYVAGMSAGGAMAAILAAQYPELFAALGVHSGLPPGAAHDVRTGLESMRVGSAAAPGTVCVPTIVFHGDADQTVHPANGLQVLAAAQAAGAERRAQDVPRSPGRRGATRQVLCDAAGTVVAEHWSVHGAAHAWSGGSAEGSYTDPAGPDASAEMLRFFLEHPRKR